MAEVGGEEWGGGGVEGSSFVHLFFNLMAIVNWSPSRREGKMYNNWEESFIWARITSTQHCLRMCPLMWREP